MQKIEVPNVQNDEYDVTESYMRYVKAFGYKPLSDDKAIIAQKKLFNKLLHTYAIIFLLGMVLLGAIPQYLLSATKGMTEGIAAFLVIWYAVEFFVVYNVIREFQVIKTLGNNQFQIDLQAAKIKNPTE
ncbi:hypothetical protein ACFBZI_11140 [Moraxella sp. ZJ142]|uniref:hypothetical protein n=1 Tax=Moraxella marmotae TaxID=3344520 RepID=UPI0035D4EFAC